MGGKGVKQADKGPGEKIRCRFARPVKSKQSNEDASPSSSSGAGYAAPIDAASSSAWEPTANSRYPQPSSLKMSNIGVTIRAVSGTILQNVDVDSAAPGRHLMYSVSQQHPQGCTGVWRLLHGHMPIDMSESLAEQRVADGSELTLVLVRISEQQ